VLESDVVRVEFETARGRIVEGKDSQVAAFFVVLEVESEQLTVPERGELLQRLTTRVVDAIAEEFGGEEIEIRRRHE